MVDTDDTRRTTDDGRRTTPRVWHKLPTGELKMYIDVHRLQLDEHQQSHLFNSLYYQTMNMENITRVRRLDLNTVLYSGSAYQSQGSSAAGHWIRVYIPVLKHPKEFIFSSYVPVSINAIY